MKTEHIQKQLDFFVRDKAHHAYRCLLYTSDAADG